MACPLKERGRMLGQAEHGMKERQTDLEGLSLEPTEAAATKGVGGQTRRVPPRPPQSRLVYKERVLSIMSDPLEVFLP